MFFPTYSFTMERGPFSVFPDALNPAMSLLAYHGDLGIDGGVPQSVFELDTDDMEQFEKADGKPFRVDLAPGKRVELPDGLGSIRFDGWQRWVKVQVSDSPGKGVALAGVSLAMPPALLQLDDTGFRAFKKQVAGPSQGRWEAVQSVSTQAGEHGPVMFIVHTAGVHTAVPLALLDARAETVEADVRRRLDQAHGYRRLT